MTKIKQYLATLTYDPVTLLSMVAQDQDIAFSLLHDEGVKHVNAFGIRNTDYPPGNFAYGIPQPGIMLISADSIILRKFAEADYRVRPDFADVLAAAKAL